MEQKSPVQIEPQPCGGAPTTRPWGAPHLSSFEEDDIRGQRQVVCVVFVCKCTDESD